VVLERREQMRTSNSFLRRLMNQKMYSAFKKWYDTWRTAVRVRAKFARVLMGKKRYFFEKWNENGLKGQSQRIIKELQNIKAERGRFIGLSRGMTTVVHEIIASGLETITYDDLNVLKRAIDKVNNFQGLEEKAALRVQTRWRTRNGQLAYQLILAGRRQKANEELKAVMLLSRVIRGRQGRRASLKMKEKYRRERRQEQERERWIQETEENEFRETLMAKRAMELKLEQARMKSELAKHEAEEQKWKNKQMDEEKKRHELNMAKERNDQVSAFGGWVETTDVRTGDVYYHNELTGKTQWEKPAELGTCLRFFICCLFLVW
jgi:hypothetical protein